MNSAATKKPLRTFFSQDESFPVWQLYVVEGSDWAFWPLATHT